MISRFTAPAAAFALVVSLIGAVPRSAAAAESVEDFYKKNNQLTVLIGFGMGTGYEVWARLIGKTMTKYVPGHPTFVVKDMPGAGSLTMANFLYNKAPKDGSVIGSFSRNLPSQVMIGLPNAQLDPRRFIYVGSPELPTRTCAVTSEAGVNSVEDLQKKEVLMGGTGAATVPTFMPPIINKMAGTKFKVIDGYQSAAEVYLAMQRNEVHGICQGFAPIATSLPDLVKAGKLKFLFNFEEKRDPLLKGAPSIFEYIKSAEDKQIMTFINSSTELGRPYALPPGTEPAKVAALRKAFDQTMTDPEFLQDAAKAQLDVSALTGEELDEKIKALYAVPKELIDKANALMPAGASGG
jgi:tripartite-type tricarboxylate transporter receptor subunit TctC